MNRLSTIIRQGLIAAVICALVGSAPATVIAAANGAPSGTAPSTSQVDAAVPAGQEPQTAPAVPATDAPSPTQPAGPMGTNTGTGQGTGSTAAAATAQPPANEAPAAADSAIATTSEPVASSGNSLPAQHNGPAITSDAANPGLELATDAKTSLETSITSTAGTGSVATIENTKVGDTKSGDALAIANVINLLQSSAAFAGGSATVFTADIQGTVNGDFMLDPSTLGQPAGGSGQQLSDLTIYSQDQGSITNDIMLEATSGAATAERNTTAGDVASGSANAVANVVNMINSTVASGSSFFGVINIFGDLIGNILMPAGSLDALLAGSGPVSVDDTGHLETSADQSIHNNVELAAQSGEVAAFDNTRTGTVATGDSSTKLTILNLTGRQIVASNSLLVFVNVLGSWVGLIMDAPAGATSAAIGGGVEADSTAAATGSNATTEFQGSITNNIYAGAQSGEVYAGQNTTTGDIMSGTANASANIANLMHSSFSVSDWFGVLFINVFGSWKGNFGVAQPPASSQPSPPPSGTGGTGSGATGNPAQTGGQGQGGIIGFAPRAASATTRTIATYWEDVVVESSPVQLVSSVQRVLGSRSQDKQPAGANNPVVAQVVDNGFNWSSLFVGLGLAGLAFVGVDRARTNLRTRRVWRLR